MKKLLCLAVLAAFAPCVGSAPQPISSGVVTVAPAPNMPYDPDPTEIRYLQQSLQGRLTKFPYYNDQSQISAQKSQIP